MSSSIAMQWIVLWGGIAITGSVLGGVFASIKNRDTSHWIFWGFLVPPIVFWLLLLPRYKGQRPRRPTLDEIDRHENGPL